jgi:N-methylhydantoinase A/oxoprolinase/acetone carboxylase beta subunit
MTVGIDIGGTNTDGAVVDEDVITFKVPNEVGLGGILKEIAKTVDLKKERVIVSTSIALNTILTKDSKTLTLLFPGCGLDYSGYGVVLSGMVNHRGDHVEEIDEEEILSVLRDNKADNVAICGKFSIRNPILEIKAREIVEKFYPLHDIALSYHVNVLGYPLRINTTVINAKIKKSVFDLVQLVKRFVDDFYLYKGDGGIIPYKLALENPSLLYNSSPASLVLGAYHLTKIESALIIDVGGTTTDFVELVGGKPKIVENVEILGKKTAVRCVKAFSLPFGGDSLAERELKPTRLDKPIAFGGSHFTLTDALNCLGCEIGDYRKSRDHEMSVYAEGIFESYVGRVVETLKGFDFDVIIGAGYLARYLIPEIAKRVGAKYVIPEHHEVMNAVGVAVSKLTLSLYSRFDTEGGFAVFNGSVEPFERGNFREDFFIEKAVEKLRLMAKSFGVEEFDYEVLYFRCWNVVRGGYVRGNIADVIVQIKD